jgi:hypothetical protein
MSHSRTETLYLVEVTRNGNLEEKIIELTRPEVGGNEKLPRDVQVGHVYMVAQRIAGFVEQIVCPSRKENLNLSYGMLKSSQNLRKRHRIGRGNFCVQYFRFYRKTVQVGLAVDNVQHFHGERLLTCEYLNLKIKEIVNTKVFFCLMTTCTGNTDKRETPELSILCK